MRIGSRILLKMNRMFKPVVHPFNLQNDGTKTYAMWQYEKGYDTVKLFCDQGYSLEEMFQGKNVLDMGCGAAGKSLYYVSCGAKKVTGVDLVSHYEQEAYALAEHLGLRDRFEFVRASAYELPFSDHSFDTIIMNDFMEHVDHPEKALEEALRLIKEDGRIYINFPPYYHPTGAHLSDAIYIPWVHIFFSEKTLIESYRFLIRDVPDYTERVALRFSQGKAGKEHITYINKMTLSRFKKICKKMNIHPECFCEVALRRYFKFFAVIPGIKEMFVKMAVVVIHGKKNG